MENRAYSFYPKYCNWDGCVLPVDNRIAYNEANNNSAKQQLEEIAPGVILYEYPGKRIFALDHNTESLIFDVLYEIKTISLKNNEGSPAVQKTAIRQLQLYKEAGAEHTETLPSRIFWDYIAKKADVVVTSDEQTVDGKRFWAAQIGKAFRKKLRVSHWDENRKVITPIPTEYDFKNVVSSYYGDLPRYKASRVIIEL